MDKAKPSLARHSMCVSAYAQPQQSRLRSLPVAIKEKEVVQPSRRAQNGLFCENLELVGRVRCAPQPRAQAGAVDPARLHRDEQLAMVCADVEHRHDIRAR